MELKEGSKLAVNVVARNAFGRVLPTPADLVVTFNGVAIAAQADGSYAVDTNGTLSAVAGGVAVTEQVGIVFDNVVASLKFEQAADGTQTVVEVPVTA